MNRKSKIIVSVVGASIVLLALLGLTYAYYLTRIQGNTNTNSISVTTADLKLVYGDGNGLVTANDIMPGTTITKTFTVTNAGKSKVEGYLVVLENVINNLNRKQDLIYTLTCNLNDNTSCGNVLETMYPNSTDVAILFPNNIEVGATHNYVLTITYENYSNIDQSEDMGKTFSGKVNIIDANTINPYETGITATDTKSLQYHILNNKAIVERYDNEGNSLGTIINSNIHNLTLINDVSDNAGTSGLYIVQDDYGPSYIYRGTVRNNYVNFAGFTWRIIRINGDGTIRLILDGTLDKVCNTQNSTVCTTSAFNESNNDNAYVGYMYGLTGMTESDNTNKCLKLVEDTVTDVIETYTTEAACTEAGGTWTTSAYEATHANIKSSTIKKKIDSFYQTFLINYNQYIADSIFCADKSLTDSQSATNNSVLGYGQNISYYKSWRRFWVKTYTPILTCDNESNNNFSRYTVEKKTIGKIETNGSLTYPIGLLSIDELVYGGAHSSKGNLKYYLVNSENIGYNWATMSPDTFFETSNGKTAMVFATSIGNNYSFYNQDVNVSLGVRPVINLKANVLYDSGNGTEETPYTIVEEIAS